MTIAEIEEKAGQVRHLRWLEEIAESYSDILKRINVEKEKFCVCGIVFTAGSEREEFFRFNGHRTISVELIRQGLIQVLADIMNEINKTKAEIES